MTVGKDSNGFTLRTMQCYNMCKSLHNMHSRLSLSMNPPIMLLKCLGKFVAFEAQQYQKCLLYWEITSWDLGIPGCMWREVVSGVSAASGRYWEVRPLLVPALPCVDSFSKNTVFNCLLISLHDNVQWTLSIKNYCPHV